MQKSNPTEKSFDVDSSATESSLKKQIPYKGKECELREYIHFRKLERIFCKIIQIL